MEIMAAGHRPQMSSNQKKAAITAGIATVAAAGLGLAVQKRVLKPTKIVESDLMLQKAAKKAQNFFFAVGRKISIYGNKAKNIVLDLADKAGKKFNEIFPKKAPKETSQN